MYTFIKKKNINETNNCYTFYLYTFMELSHVSMFMNDLSLHFLLQYFVCIKVFI